MNPLDRFKAVLITRNNILSVLSLSIKDLLDQSCFQDSLDDYIKHVVNFLTILEHVTYFRVQGNSLVFSQSMKNHPWKLFSMHCESLPNSCISTIKQLDNLTDDFARVRAIFRIGLMEKRLHDYLSSAFNDKKLNSKFYSSHSIILSEHFPNVINQLIGLSAVDFSFDLKSNLSHPGFYPIDYSLYLSLKSSPQSLLDDINECHSCNGGMEYCYWREKYELILAKAKVDSEQKSYLEEIVMNRDSKISALERRNEIFSSEMKSLENSVTDLQIQLTLLHEQYSKEIEKFGGNSTVLNVPSVKSVIGSRADVLSNRHPLMNQFSQIDAALTSDLAKECPYTSPLPQLTPFTFTGSVQDCYTKLSKMAASTGDLRSRASSQSQSKESLDNSQGKFIIGKQLISNQTQIYFSPKNDGKRNRSSNNCVESHENNNSDYCSRLFDMKYDEQRTRIKESQQLRKIMGQACRSPMIKAHRKCAQDMTMPKSQSYDLVETYSFDEMSELSISFNYSNSYDDRTSPDKVKYDIHSPDDESNYYHLSTISAFEQLSEDDYFEVESLRVTELFHRDHVAPVVNDGITLFSPPELERQSPILVAEVPAVVEPLVNERNNFPSSDNFINGDRGSGRSRNSAEEE